MINTDPDNKDIVSFVTLRLGSNGDSKKEQVWTRPITKIALVLETEGIDSPTKGALYDEQGDELLVGSHL